MGQGGAIVTIKTQSQFNNPARIKATVGSGTTVWDHAADSSAIGKERFVTMALSGP